MLPNLLQERILKEKHASLHTNLHNCLSQILNNVSFHNAIPSPMPSNSFHPTVTVCQVQHCIGVSDKLQSYLREVINNQLVNVKDLNVLFKHSHYHLFLFILGFLIHSFSLEHRLHLRCLFKDLLEKINNEVVALLEVLNVSLVVFEHIGNELPEDVRVTL